jgi:hypothetical protein
MHDDSVLIYSRLMRHDEAEDATRPYRPVMATAPTELAREVASGRNLHAVVVQIDELSPELERLLRSIRRHFPVLPIVFVTDAEIPRAIDAGYSHISNSQDEEQKREALRIRLGEIARRDRRQYTRYDWPLTGSIVREGAGEPPSAGVPAPGEPRFRICSLSAGGAFLEHRDGMPEAGSEITLRVCFQDSSFVTRCRVLERRMASSNLPPGQGVQFTSLSDKAREIIDRIIADALMTILLDPTAEPEVPTLGGEDLEMSLAPEFNLD